MLIQMTYKLAMAAGQDEGNRHMAQNGRSTWNEEDYSAACAEFERLWPSPSIEAS